MRATDMDKRREFESHRLDVLRSYNILDTPPEAQFDRIARLASAILGTPMAAITFVDADRQWFKAQVGLERHETSRRDSICAETMLGDGPLVVPDTLADIRFAHSALVVSDPHTRFYVGVPLKARDGSPLGAVCGMDREPRTVGQRQIALLTDLAQLAMEQLELRHVASEDGLTGVMRRSAFVAAAERDLAIARRSSRQMACLMIDADNFKTINDQYGHAAGDRVLIALTDTIRAGLRRSDLIGRLGGDEFCVLLAETGEEGGLETARRLLQSIGRTRAVTLDGSVIPFTVSIGGTEATPLDINFAAVMDRADRALYSAKDDGRDRLHWRAPT